MKKSEEELRALCKSWLSTGLINEEVFIEIEKDLNVFISNNNLR